MTTKPSIIILIVSKIYYPPSEVVLSVRRRPNPANGGGFPVADCSQRVVFRVDGCGVLGRKEEMILWDRNSLLLIRRKGAIVEALSFTRQWKGFTYDFIGSHKLVFTLKEPNSCFSKKTPIKISIESKECSNYGSFEVQGNFSARSCCILNSRGAVVAQIGVEEKVQQLMQNRDLYHVSIKPGMDQAFVFGVIVVLDYCLGKI